MRQTDKVKKIDNKVIDFYKRNGISVKSTALLIHLINRRKHYEI